MTDAEKIRELEEKVKCLELRVKMLDIEKEQSMITLKKDISNAISLDVVDFKATKNSPYNDDLFEAYRAMIKRTFKVLNRYGINA